MKDISIITVNFNGFEITSELVVSLQKVGFDGDIIIVDNGSKIDETAMFKARFPEVIAIRSDNNLGFAGGNNLGLQHCKTNYILFVNNDTTVVDQFWIPLVKRMEEDEKIGLICPKILFEYAPDTIQFAGYTLLHPITLRNNMIGFNEKDQGQHQKPMNIPYAMGAAMLTTRNVIEKAGNMPECYFLYYEELDWSERIREAGYTIWYEPNSKIFHKESVSTGKMSPMKQYYLTRNRLFYVRRNLKGTNRFLAIIYQMFISLSKNSISFLLKRRFDLFYATLKGFCHGMKMVFSYDSKCN